ncbi:MAG: hypothetical protein ABIT37_07475 [Luteolibacter sp.]
MKILLAAAVLGVPVLALAYSQITIPPEQRIRLSALSEQILLVDITRVELKAPRTEDGIEAQELAISWSVDEVIRGNEHSKNLGYTCTDFRVFDEVAYKKANGGSPSPEWFHGTPATVQTGAAEVKEGSRCLVIYFGGSAFFVPVLPDDKSWRDKILKLQKPDENKQSVTPKQP